MERPGAVWRVPGLGLLVAVVLTTAACTNLVYSAKRDQQGQAAVKAAAETKLLDAVLAVEKRFSSLVDLEAEAARKRHALIRELEIRQVAFEKKPVAQWIAQLDARFVEITGAGATGADWQHVLDKNDPLKTALAQVEERRQAFTEVTGVKAPTCAEALGSEALPARVPDATKPQAAPLYRQLRSKCPELVAAQRAYDEAFRAARAASAQPGQLGRALAQLTEDERDKDDAQRRIAAAKTAFEAAGDRYAQETAASAKPSRKHIEGALKALRDGVEAIEKEHGMPGREAVAGLRLERLDDVLGALTRGEVDTSKWGDLLKKAAALAGTLPSLANETERTLARKKKPRLVPYALAREHQRLLVVEATTVAAIRDRRVAAATRIVDAYRAEIEVLLRVRTHIKADWHDLEISKLTALAPETRRELYELLGVYFDEVPRLQAEQRVLEYRRLATFQEESTERSKHAALMWQNLINGVVTSLAGYHASGVKPETIAEFVKALGLLFIGAGVM